jgi:hypothetical protein
MDGFSRHLNFLSSWGDFLVSFFLAARSLFLCLRSAFDRSDNTGVITRQPHCRLTLVARRHHGLFSYFIEADIPDW